jgi:hypothetical protein
MTHRIPRSLAAAALGLLPAVVAQAPRDANRWFTGSIAGRPVGYVHEHVAVNARGEQETRTESRMVLNRLGRKVEIVFAARALEAAGAGLLAVDSEMKLSERPVRTQARVGDGAVTLRDADDPAGSARELPFEGEMLGPEGVRRRSLARLRVPGDRIDYTTYSPELTAVTSVSRRVLGRELIEGGGVSMWTLAVEERVAALPFATKLWLDGDARIVRTEQPGPFGTMRTERSDEAAARRAADGGELPEESYVATTARTQIRLPRAREIEALTLELRLRDAALGWPELAADNQQVRERTPERLVVEITRPQPRAGERYPVAVTAENAPYLAPNAWLQSRDSELVALAQSVVAGEPDLYLAARRLERWVGEHMTFDAGIVMAPSTEVLRNRRGTCSEFATLLAAMARAVGIPARYVLGYVYVDGMLGGHAWTEVLVGADWIPLDAVMAGSGPADAARFAFGWSSLADGIGASMQGPGLQLFGRIDVRVLGYSLDGQRVRVAPDAVPFVVDGDTYRDTGLGFALARPQDFAFASLGETWPSNVLVAIAGGGARLTVHAAHCKPWEEPEARARALVVGRVPGGACSELTIAGRSAPLVETDGAAALAVPAGSDVYLLVAEGADAPALLRRTAATLRLPR